MSWRPLLRYAAREARGSARLLAFFVACLAVGVAAITSVSGLSAGVEAGVRASARDLLGADAVIQSWRPLPELDEALDGTGVRRTMVKELVTLAARTGDGGVPGRSQLVELRVVEPDYPFYGAPQLDPPRPLRELLTPATTVVAGALLDRLGLGIGDTLHIGGQDFRIAGRVLSESDTVSGALRLGPRAFLSHQGLARTSLEAFGSRILRRALLKLPDDAGPRAGRRLVSRLRRHFDERDDLRIETYREAQPAVRRTLQRMEPYLSLVALVSLLLGGIGVGQGVRAWIRGRLDSIAVLRAIGVRPREVLFLFFAQVLALTLAGSAAGVIAGLVVVSSLPRWLPGLLPPGLLQTVWLEPSLHGLAVGVAVAAVFSAGPLLTVVRVPPSRVFRREAEPLPWPRGLRVAGGFALLGALVAVAAFESRSALRGALFTVGLLVAIAVTAGAARLISRAASRLGRRSGPLVFRYGAAGLARPGSDTLGAVTALGLGAAVVVALAVVERHVVRELDGDLPRTAPTAFFVDIQRDQWPGVESLLAQSGATQVDSVPVVTARLRAIDGARAVEVARERAPDQRWSLTREQRLTYLPSLPRGNTLVEGTLWGDRTKDEISLEQEFARSLDVGVGSVLTFEVQGVPLDLTVTSLRRVDWRTFNINFFALVEPGVLDAAPQTRLAAARLPAEQETALQDALAARHPNITVILVRDVLQRVADIVSKLAAGVRFLGAFTSVAGLAILAAAFHVAAQRRGREVALLKTLGFTRGQVVAALAVEYSLIGLTAGLVGTGAGALLAWGVIHQVLELEWQWSWGLFASAGVATAFALVVTSLAATLPALQARPGRVFQAGD